MDVTPLIKEGQKIVQNYRDGGFTISGERVEGAVILTPSDIIKWPVDKSFEQLELKDFDLLEGYKSEFDVFLLGAGQTMKFLPKDLKTSLIQQGINFDVMDTGAACRTYNVLMAEGRRVLCALMPA